MCFHCWQPLPVSRINWQILSREQSKQSLLKLPSSVSVHKNLAGILMQSCYLSPGGWVHVCVRSHACIMCLFSQKAKGSWNRLCRGRPASARLLPTQADSGARFSIHLPYIWSSGRSPTPCSVLFRSVNSRLTFRGADINPPSWTDSTQSYLLSRKTAAIPVKPPNSADQSDVLAPCSSVRTTGHKQIALPFIGLITHNSRLDFFPHTAFRGHSNKALTMEIFVCVKLWANKKTSGSH